MVCPVDHLGDITSLQNLRGRAPISPFRIEALFGCFPILYRRKGDARIQGYAQRKRFPRQSSIHNRECIQYVQYSTECKPG